MPSRDAQRRAEAALGGAGLEQRFDRHSLVSLRAAVAAHGDRFGLVGDRLADLLLVAHELASNAIQHGGGGGRLRLWCRDGTIYCLVDDSGGGFAGATHAGLLTPQPDAARGRGLWLVRRLADEITIQTGAAGTSVTATIAVNDRPGDGGYSNGGVQSSGMR
jgi:anti-sigma regulatory factor (Ser/Thr protein kinase)